MNDKELFANTICDLDERLGRGLTACEKYGMTWGCDEDCPVLNNEECKIYKDVKDYLENN